MKKIILAFLSLTFLLSFVTIEDKSPTKSETFDYILHQIMYVNLCYGHQSDLYKTEIDSYDKSKNTITVKHFNPRTNCSYTDKIDLNDISFVHLFTDQQNYKKTIKYDYIGILFNSNSVEHKYYCPDIQGKGQNNNDIHFALTTGQKNVLEKLVKAFEHMQKITAPKFDPTLFDD